MLVSIPPKAGVVDQQVDGTPDGFHLLQQLVAFTLDCEIRYDNIGVCASLLDTSGDLSQPVLPTGHERDPEAFVRQS